MPSWKLLQGLTSFWRAVENPIFWRETFRPPIWQGAAAWASRASGLALMLGGLICYLHTLLVFYLGNVLILLLPILLLWTVLVGLTLAPAIVKEREGATWETLQTTPLNLEAIILGKAGGALWWLRDLMRIMSGLLMVVGIGIGAGSFAIAADPVGSASRELPSTVLCTATLLLPVGSAFVFLVDRIQYFTLLALAALSVSAASRSVRFALPGASVAALSVWGLDILSAGAILALHGGQSAGLVEKQLLPLATLGPSVSYLATMPLADAALLMAATLVVREGVIRLLWQITLYAARQE